ncbi:hypothetical protein P9D57_17860 [Bacillus sonorensis]|uniref:hypothetical protein n=1 Tax=Bacillus sonorensis TaxID=119858 RepID=UPI002DBA1DE3|nr:hypothetical protein [Bacillus sonorensis]MEC1440558.1 hypothetical protein [Bacillus sonorensis]
MSDQEFAEGAYKPKELGEEVASVKNEGLERISSLSNISGYEANKLLMDPQGNFRKIVQLSHYYTEKIGILKSAVRVYVTLTNGEIQLEGGTKKNKNFLEEFIEKTNLNKTLRQSIPDLYKAGNFVWYRELEGRESVWIHQLNPIDVEIKGHKRDRPVADLRTNNDPATLPDDLKKDRDGKYHLPPNQTYHCSVEREGYLRYGMPFTTSAFEPIQHIQELIDMEKDSIKSVIESLIIITLGDEKRPATQEQIDKLKQHVKNLKSTSRLVGNHTLKADVIEKNIEVFNKEKFEVPMRMLMQSIGITPSIFTGEGSYATASAGMQSAKKTIELIRLEIEDTLKQLFTDVAKERGLDPKKNPTVSLGKLDLTEEKVQHAILRDLYLDGIISAETYALAHGHILEHEQTKTKEEKKYDIQPRKMSSTLGNESPGAPEKIDSKPDNNPNQDKKPSGDS